ncbi:hypothetical protein V2I01_40550 [Micromonospora sp. BRA006-A]|nr:hypothetical protein [Micromonospora sp. BRA006-A]
MAPVPGEQRCRPSPRPPPAARRRRGPRADAGLTGAAPPPPPAATTAAPASRLHHRQPALPPLVVGGAATTVRQGVHANAGYIIEIPARWNGDLPRGRTATAARAPSGRPSRPASTCGSAWWRRGTRGRRRRTTATATTCARRTRHPRLADLFSRTVRRPHRVLIAGRRWAVTSSAGRWSSTRASTPAPMCGVLGDQELFDFFLDYNLVAQALAGVRAYPTPPDYLTLGGAPDPGHARPGRAGRRRGPDTTNDLGKQPRAVTVEPGGPRPGADAAFAVWKPPRSASRSARREASRPAARSARHEPVHQVHAEPAGELDATVQRVAPENLRQRALARPDRGAPDRRAAHRAGAEPARPRRPVRAVRHGRHAWTWPGTAVLAGRCSGRCAPRSTAEFSPAEAGAAGRPVRCAYRSARPVTVTDRRAVAAPDFGCRFSDRAEPAAGTGTRPLYPPC